MVNAKPIIIGAMKADVSNCMPSSVIGKGLENTLIVSVVFLMELKKKLSMHKLIQ